MFAWAAPSVPILSVVTASLEMVIMPVSSIVASPVTSTPCATPAAFPTKISPGSRVEDVKLARSDERRVGEGSEVRARLAWADQTVQISSVVTESVQMVILQDRQLVEAAIL